MGQLWQGPWRSGGSAPSGAHAREGGAQSGHGGAGGGGRGAGGRGAVVQRGAMDGVAQGGPTTSGAGHGVMQSLANLLYGVVVLMGVVPTAQWLRAFCAASLPHLERAGGAELAQVRACACMCVPVCVCVRASVRAWV